MKKGFIFLIILGSLNLFAVDEDLPQSLCFGNSIFENYGSILIDSASNILGSQTNFVEKELMRRQPDKIWPVKHASEISITHTQQDYFNKFGYKEQNSFTVQNAWLHSSWNTRIVKYGLNENYYHSALSIDLPLIGRVSCNTPWTTVDQAKRWAKWFTHGHEFYDAGIPGFDYIAAANEALANGELNKNILGGEQDYSDYTLTDVVGNMTPNFPERVRWKMINPDGENIVMLKYLDKGAGTVDTWNDFNNNQVGRAIGGYQCDGGNGAISCLNVAGVVNNSCESELTSLCYRFESEDLDIRNAHIAKLVNGKTIRTRFVSDIEKFRATYNTEQNPLDAPLFHECANFQGVKDVNDPEVYHSDCDLDGKIDGYDLCPQLCDIKNNWHEGELINEYTKEPGDNNTYEIFHQNGANFFMHCNETVFPICDEAGNKAGEANNLSSGCDDGCEGCFSCEEEDSELLCFVNGEQVTDYEGLCPGEYRCSGGSPEINEEIDIFIPGCSYPGCIPPWITGFYDPAAEEFSKVGGPVWEGMLTESIIHTMEHTYQLANTFDKSYSVVKSLNNTYGLYENVSGSWIKISDISNYPDIARSSTLVAGDVMLFAGGVNTNGVHSNKLYALNMNLQTQTQYLTMSYTDFPANFAGNVTEITTLPPDILNIGMAVSDGILYLMGNKNQNFHVYRLTDNGFELVNNSQPARINYSLTSDNNNIYVAGGFKSLNCACGEKNYRDLIRFSTVDFSWETIADNIKTDLTYVPMYKIGNKINIVNPRIRLDGKIRNIIVDTLTGEVSLEYKISLNSSAFCLDTENEKVFGGRNTGSICTPFTEKEFNSIPMGTTVNTLAGLGSKLAIGTGNQVKIYDITNPLSPILLHTKGIYGPASDMLIYGNKLIVAVENGIDTIDLNTYAYYHKSTYGSTKALRIYNGKLYAGDGQGIKVLNPDTLAVLQTKNTSGSVKKLEIMNGVIYTVEWSGLKRFNQETLAAITTNSYSISNPELRAYNGNLYASKNGTIVKLTFNSNAVVTTNLIGDKVDLRNNYSTGYLTYFPNGSNLRVSTMEEMVPAVCGNGTTETGEICDGNSVECTTLSDNYVDGTAVCNSSCSGYDEVNCEEDGW